MIAWFRAWRKRVAERRLRDEAQWNAIRSHPLLGKACTLCGKPRYWPPGDECFITHDLEFIAEAATT